MALGLGGSTANSRTNDVSEAPESIFSLSYKTVRKMRRRRQMLRTSLAAFGLGMGGCLSSLEPVSEGGTSSTRPQSTTSESPEQESPTTRDYSVDDLLILNSTEKSRTVTVAVSPEEGDLGTFTDEFVLQPEGESNEYEKVYPELEQMSYPGLVTIDVSGYDSWEYDWEGDVGDDHLGLHVYIKEDGLEVHGKVA